MKLQRLGKHFPELAHLAAAEQQALLEQAYKDAFAGDNKMLLWRNNLISATLMAALCFLLVLVIRPALGMSQQSSALILMLTAFPAYFYLQQRRFIQQLRASLKKFLP